MATDSISMRSSFMGGVQNSETVHRDRSASVVQSENAPLLMSNAKLTLPKRSQSLHVSSEASIRNTQMQGVENNDDASVSSNSLAERIAFVKNKGLDLKKVAESVEKAKSVSVDPAKRGFWQKMGGAVVAAGVVALFAAITVSTGGAAAIVGLSVAGIMLAKNAGDTYCAYKVLKNKQAQAENKEQPYKNVPMGADWIGNMCHSALSSFHKDKLASGEMSADAIKAKAKNWSLGINIALKAVSFSAGGVTGIASGAAWLPRVGSIALSAATTAIATCLDKVKQNNEQWSKNYTDEKMPDHMINLCDKYTELFEQANSLPESERQPYFEKINQGLNLLDTDLTQVEERLHKAEEKLNNPSSGAAAAVRGGLAEGLVFAGGVQAGRRYLEFLPMVKAVGMNFESAASSIMMFKSAYDCWSMMKDQAVRTQALKEHSNNIFEIRTELNAANAVMPQPNQMV